MQFPLTLDASILADVARFTVPVAAMDAIDFRAVVRDARLDGLERPSIEFATVSPSSGQVLVTCRFEIALRLLCAWTELVEHDSDLRTAEQLASVRTAAGAAFIAYIHAAYDHGRGKR